MQSSILTPAYTATPHPQTVHAALHPTTPGIALDRPGSRPRCPPRAHAPVPDPARPAAGSAPVQVYVGRRTAGIRALAREKPADDTAATWFKHHVSPPADAMLDPFWISCPRTRTPHAGHRPYRWESIWSTICKEEQPEPLPRSGLVLAGLFARACGLSPACSATTTWCCHRLRCSGLGLGRDDRARDPQGFSSAFLPQLAVAVVPRARPMSTRARPERASGPCLSRGPRAGRTRDGCPRDSHSILLMDQQWYIVYSSVCRCG